MNDPNEADMSDPNIEPVLSESSPSLKVILNYHYEGLKAVVDIGWNITGHPRFDHITVNRSNGASKTIASGGSNLSQPVHDSHVDYTHTYTYTVLLSRGNSPRTFTDVVRRTGRHQGTYPCRRTA
jgi:hypothetical protein